MIQDQYDLVIKEVDPKANHLGFKAADMALLRKCPCPVWLIKSTNGKSKQLKVAVAIDPESDSTDNNRLSIQMIQLANNLAKQFRHPLHVISCWQSKFEKYLRHNPMTQMRDDAIDEAVQGFQTQHRTALDQLILEAALDNQEIQVAHVNGPPDQQIPQYVIEHNIDLLVMGTVGRRGIPGFLIGNTAENILQDLPCSLIALKPDGFVSPVTVS